MSEEIRCSRLGMAVSEQELAITVNHDGGRSKHECMPQGIGSPVDEHSMGHATLCKTRSCTPQSFDSGAAVSFELSISSLHSGARFGLLCCASLNQFPDHYSPGYHSLRHGTLADLWFD